MKKFLIWTVGILVVLGAAAFWFIRTNLIQDPFEPLFASECASCHGDVMQGGENGPALVGERFALGQGVVALQEAIRNHPEVPDLPATVRTLEDAQIRGLAIFIGETRTDRKYRTFEIDEPLEIPEQLVSSDVHEFRVATFARGIDPLPFSIAPLPNGEWLVTEKERGLRIISPEGELSDYVQGTPPVFDDSYEFMLTWGHGWMLDVALHPDYEENGWIYIHHTDRCDDCASTTVSRNSVVRGRIVDGQWVDQELIWQPSEEHFSRIPDIAAGGRLAFDDQHRLYISVGLKGTTNFDHFQDLSKPAGKVHRVHDDGTIPLDNPFLSVEGAFQSAYTYGHRSPQGLEFNHRTGEMWETEMGPRGGDEVNLLVAGKNYGWPLTSLGINYDGSHVDYGKLLNIEFDIADIQQPKVDLTPGPAVSSFAFYEGDQFPGWQGHALVGSLAARELYRINVQTGEVELLLANIGRIRDVEIGFDGLVYLLLEHPGGGVVVRLSPERGETSIARAH